MLPIIEYVVADPVSFLTFMLFHLDPDAAAHGVRRTTDLNRD
jgi:hypothetical protein